MRKKFDILICGVGGQGILLCSNVIGVSAVEEGVSVRGVEVHGMAQRGGSVEAHIRLNCNYGPKIPSGKADLLIGFEPLEAARYSVYLKKNGICIVNSYKIPVLRQDYEEEEMVKIIKKRTKRIYIENFTEMAKKIGSVKIVNILIKAQKAGLYITEEVALKDEKEPEEHGHWMEARPGVLLHRLGNRLALANRFVYLAEQILEHVVPRRLARNLKGFQDRHAAGHERAESPHRAGDRVLFHQLAEDGHLNQEEVEAVTAIVKSTDQLDEEPDRDGNRRNQEPPVEQGVGDQDQHLRDRGQLRLEFLEDLAEFGDDLEHDERQNRYGEQDHGHRQRNAKRDAD